MNPFVGVAIFGALGSVVRYAASVWLTRQPFPLGTLVVNLLGSLLIGLVAGYFAARGDSPIRLYLTTGFLGGFTTFSAFSLESVTLLSGGEAKTAAVYIAATLVGGLACCALGWFTTSMLGARA